MTKSTATTTHIKNKLDISELQKLVGGYVEVINLPNNKTNLICNEDGKMFWKPSEILRDKIMKKVVHGIY